MITGFFTLFDDESTREKHTVMSKWDIIICDSRNKAMIDYETTERFLEFGKKYKITVEEITNG